MNFIAATIELRSFISDPINAYGLDYRGSDAVVPGGSGASPLGQRERAVLLQVGEEQILIGVAAGSVSALHRISHPVAPSEAETSLSFKDVWDFARSKQGGNE